MLINALAKVLCETDRVCASVNVASTKAEINMDAVAKLGGVIHEVAERTAHQDMGSAA